jgi:hypothetical protein
MNIFETIVKDIEGIPADIVKLFTNPKAEAALKEAATLAVQAGPIVQAIAAIVPGSPTVQAVAAAYAKYGVPYAQEALSSPTQLGNDLLNLATAEVGKLAPGVSVSSLNTAVQLAVTMIKAAAPPAATKPSA